MSYNAFVDSRTRQVNKAAIAAGTPGVASAARWFWWIAGLSLVNTVMIHSGSETNFVLGLAFTMVADLRFHDALSVAIAIDAAAIGFFVLMGWLALRGHFWAFLAGAVIYGMDALIYLKLGAIMSVGFHVFALFFIVRGAFALRGAITAAEICAMEEAPAVAPPALPSDTPPPLG